jgi:hypothetical protein
LQAWTPDAVRCGVHNAYREKDVTSRRIAFSNQDWCENDVAGTRRKPGVLNFSAGSVKYDPSRTGKSALGQCPKRSLAGFPRAAKFLHIFDGLVGVGHPEVS